MANQPQHVVINNQQLRCTFCQGDMFIQRKGMFGGRAIAIFDLEWLGKSADVYVCSKCGYAHWFQKR